MKEYRVVDKSGQQQGRSFDREHMEALARFMEASEKDGVKQYRPYVIESRVMGPWLREEGRDA